MPYPSSRVFGRQQRFNWATREEQVQSPFPEGGPLPNMLGLVAWYPLDEGTGRILTDYSGNAFNIEMPSKSTPAWVIDGAVQGIRFVWETTSPCYVNPVGGLSPSADELTFVVCGNLRRPVNHHSTFASFNPAWNGHIFAADSYSPIRLEYNKGIQDAYYNTGEGDLNQDHAWIFTQSGTTPKIYRDGAPLAFTYNGISSPISGIYQAGLGDTAWSTKWSDWDAHYLIIFDRELSSEEIATLYAHLQPILAARGLEYPEPD